MTFVAIALIVLGLTLAALCGVIWALVRVVDDMAVKLQALESDDETTTPIRWDD